MAPTVDAEHELNGKLYDALLKEEEDKVIKLCQDILDGPLHVLTIHGDTVLHMATYTKQEDLVCNLLKLSEHHSDKLMHRNVIGNTVLHEAAISDRTAAAKIMLRMAPNLLSARNDNGETALFRAARYGKKTMFKFLDSEVNKKAKLSESDLMAFHQRDDMTTILHMTILCDHFDLALQIAKRYDYLVDKQDEDGMTGLQLLSCDASAFRNRIEGNYLKQLFYSCISTEDTTMETGEGISTEDTTMETGEDRNSWLKVTNFVNSRSWNFVVPGFRVPLWEAIRAEKQRYKSAVQLAKFLSGKDTSWEATESAKGESKPKTHAYESSSTVLKQQRHVGSRQKSPTGDEIGTEDTLPLGNPQKSQDTNEKVAETPLMSATKYGCTEIVEAILKKYPQAVEHVDVKGRNILHLAIKYRHIKIFNIVERMGFPMIRLIRKLDNNGNTILHYVGIKKEAHGSKDMRSPALVLQEDLLLFERVQKVTATNFVKHFNDNDETAEELFADNVLSLTFALTSVITFLSILTSSFQLKDFKQSLPQKLMLGLTFLIFSVSMMMFAFAATVILLIRNKERWTKIALYSVAFFPVTIFALSYMPLYMSLIKTFQYSLNKIWTVFPRSESGLPHKPFKVRKSHARSAVGSTYPSTLQSTQYPIALMVELAEFIKTKQFNKQRKSFGSDIRFVIINSTMDSLKSSLGSEPYHFPPGHTKLLNPKRLRAFIASRFYHFVEKLSLD
ncbi:hypothetical protein RJ639_003082 [Escallonia herrerae]|uniref:PGG domain-containing protein n=1 Tax=Escallonia herrerae TaxID=1293975 RepID=A0AA88VYE1_9ASTE|nr:hypothetical protein RJ639_003082 [Escallonia herrerae]